MNMTMIPNFMIQLQFFESMLDFSVLTLLGPNFRANIDSYTQKAWNWTTYFG